MRAAKHAWKIQRGERVEEANATKAIYVLLEGIGEREAKEVDRLAPLIDTDHAAVRQLRTFLGGIDYLWQEWSILKARLSRGKHLLYSERQRCFRLLGTSWESVLRGEPVATRLLKAQIGVACGAEATLEEVRGFLGGRPPVGMPEAEFTMRVKELAASPCAQARSVSRSSAKIVGEAMDELKTVRQEVQEQTERHLELDSISARSSRRRRGPGSRIASIRAKGDSWPRHAGYAPAAAGTETRSQDVRGFGCGPDGRRESAGRARGDSFAPSRTPLPWMLTLIGPSRRTGRPTRRTLRSRPTVDADEPETEFPAVVTASGRHLHG